MMVSPETYVEIFLKGKTVNEIEKQIRIIKKELSHCTKVIERPYEYPEEMSICPSPGTRLQMNELYLEEAKKALAKAGGEYVPTKAELKQAKIKDKLKHIKKFTFSIGGFLQETTKHVVEITDILNYRNETFPECNFVTDKTHHYTKDNFFEMIEGARIEKWKHHYHAPVMDGEQWEIKIEFDNGEKPLKYYGSNAYPFSFEWITNFFDGEAEFDE